MPFRMQRGSLRTGLTSFPGFATVNRFRPGIDVFGRECEHPCGAGEGTRNPNRPFTSRTYVRPGCVRWCQSARHLRNVRDSGTSSSGEDRVGRPMPPHLLPRPYRTLCSNAGERMATSWQPGRHGHGGDPSRRRTRAPPCVLSSRPARRHARQALQLRVASAGASGSVRQQVWSTYARWKVLHSA